MCEKYTYWETQPADIVKSGNASQALYLKVSDESGYILIINLSNFYANEKLIYSTSQLYSPAHKEEIGMTDWYEGSLCSIQ